MAHPPIRPLPGPPAANAACAQLRQDIATYQALLDQLNRELASTEGFNARQKILDDIAITSRVLQDTEANYAQYCGRGPIPPVHFNVGQWQLQSPYGIQLGDLWQTGSVWAVHPLPGDRLLVGTEQGGLWLSQPNGSGGYHAQCLSNGWSHWGFSAFVADPADPDRIFAGVNDTFADSLPGIDGNFGGVYIGRASRPNDSWSFVPLPLSAPGGIRSMIIVPGLRRLLAVTGAGLGGSNSQIHWMDIDSPPLAWQSDFQTASDLANAEGDSFLITDQVNASLSIGKFSGSGIATIPVGDGAIHWNTIPASFTPMRIASCKTQPNHAYCLGYVGNLQSLFVIRTQDGGNAWTECTYYEPNLLDPNETLSKALDAFDSGAKSPYSIAVHPTDPLTVAIGYGSAALTNDGGSRQWLALNNAGTVPAVAIHADIHELCFDDATPTLFIPSDGGLLTLPSLALSINPPLPFGFSVRYFPGDTRRNRTLPVVMLEGNPPRQSLGNVAAAGGIVVTGTQDNANLWLDPSTQIWTALEDGGDGGVVAISAQPSGTYVLHGQNAGSDNVPVQWAQWEGSSWGSSTLVPVAGTTSGLIPLMRTVAPRVGLFAIWQVIALATPTNNVIFGAVVAAFPTAPPYSIPTQAVWIRLGALPHTEVITALEAFDSGSVLAGTASGRLFRVSLNSGAPTEIHFDERVIGPVTGIASDGNTVLCINRIKLAVLDRTETYAFSGQPVAVGGKPQPLSRLSTAAFPANTNKPLRSVCANRNSKFLGLTFAIAIDQNEVWVSNSPLAAVWFKAVDGLPLAVRCSDLVFTESVSEGQLFLSTYGRGLWKLAF